MLKRQKIISQKRCILEKKVVNRFWVFRRRFLYKVASKKTFPAKIYFCYLVTKKINKFDWKGRWFRCFAFYNHEILKFQIYLKLNSNLLCNFKRFLMNWEIPELSWFFDFQNIDVAIFPHTILLEFFWFVSTFIH